jgi:hypothetical protein
MSLGYFWFRANARGSLWLIRAGRQVAVLVSSEQLWLACCSVSFSVYNAVVIWIMAIYSSRNVWRAFVWLLKQFWETRCRFTPLVSRPWRFQPVFQGCPMEMIIRIRYSLKVKCQHRYLSNCDIVNPWDDEADHHGRHKSSLFTVPRENSFLYTSSTVGMRFHPRSDADNYVIIIRFFSYTASCCV